MSRAGIRSSGMPAAVRLSSHDVRREHIDRRFPHFHSADDDSSLPCHHSLSVGTIRAGPSFGPDPRPFLFPFALSVRRPPDPRLFVHRPTKTLDTPAILKPAAQGWAVIPREEPLISATLPVRSMFISLAPGRDNQLWDSPLTYQCKSGSVASRPDSAQRFPANLGVYRRLNRSGSTARDSAMDAQLVPEAEIHWSGP